MKIKGVVSINVNTPISHLPLRIDWASVAVVESLLLNKRCHVKRRNNHVVGMAKEKPDKLVSRVALDPQTWKPAGGKGQYPPRGFSQEQN